jgi:hypothetical protein
VLCLVTAIAFGGAALLSDASSATTSLPSVSTAPAYLPGDSSGILRVVLVFAVVLLIVVQLWLLGRRLPGERMMLPVQRLARRKRSGSSMTSPNSSTRNW